MRTCRKNPCQVFVGFFTSFYSKKTCKNYKFPDEIKIPTSVTELTSTQEEILDSYIGSNGIYVASIRNNQDFPTHIKVLYLTRSISLTPKNFLAKLEQLYVWDREEPHLNVFRRRYPDDSVLEIIKCLKLINDLYHNHLIKFDCYGQRRALDHFFNGCGVINLVAFKSAIERRINCEIDSLKQKSISPPYSFETILDSDKIREREYDERYIIGNAYLPKILDLPLKQRAPGIFLSCFDTFNTNESAAERELLDIPRRINLLASYKLDNQSNFNIITSLTNDDYPIAVHLSTLMDILRNLHYIGILTSQSNFDKLVDNHKYIVQLGVIFERLAFTMGVNVIITQQSFDLLIHNAMLADQIHIKLIEASIQIRKSGCTFDNENLVTIIKNVRRKHGYDFEEYAYYALALR